MYSTMMTNIYFYSYISLSAQLLFSFSVYQVYLASTTHITPLSICLRLNDINVWVDEGSVCVFVWEQCTAWECVTASRRHHESTAECTLGIGTKRNRAINVNFYQRSPKSSSAAETCVLTHNLSHTSVLHHLNRYCRVIFYPCMCCIYLFRFDFCNAFQCKLLILNRIKTCSI